MAHMRASIGPPHNRDYQRLFQSLLWTLLMRVLLPSCAFHTALLALFEIRRVYVLKHNRRKNVQQSMSLGSLRLIHQITVWLEAPSMILIGLELIFGAFGPYALPYDIHVASYFMFNGLSVATTLLLAILIREETRAAGGLPRRHIFEHYRFTVVLICVVFLGWDIMWVAAAFNKHLTYAASPRTVVLVFAAAFLAQGGAGIYFIVQARYLRSHLMKLFANSMATANANKILRLLTWLNIAGIACLLATLALCAKFVALLGFMIEVIHVIGFCIVHFLAAFGRIMVSYSQVKKDLLQHFSRICSLLNIAFSLSLYFLMLAHRYNR